MYLNWKRLWWNPLAWIVGLVIVMLVTLVNIFLLLGVVIATPFFWTFGSAYKDCSILQIFLEGCEVILIYPGKENWKVY